MKIRKELKNAAFVYDEEKKCFYLSGKEGELIELNKVYAFAFMRFVVRVAQRNWLRTKKNVDKAEAIMVELESDEIQDPNQLTMFEEQL